MSLKKLCFIMLCLSNSLFSMAVKPELMQNLIKNFKSQIKLCSAIIQKYEQELNNDDAESTITSKQYRDTKILQKEASRYSRELSDLLTLLRTNQNINVDDQIRQLITMQNLIDDRILKLKITGFEEFLACNDSSVSESNFIQNSSPVTGLPPVKVSSSLQVKNLSHALPLAPRKLTSLQISYEPSNDPVIKKIIEDRQKDKHPRNFITTSKDITHNNFAYGLMFDIPQKPIETHSAFGKRLALTIQEQRKKC